GRPLPAGLASGVFPYFSNLWNAADGMVPSDPAWSGWTGSPADVIVQRINLAPLFLHMLLNRYNTTNTGAYSVDGLPAVSVVTVDGYFIRGSVLGLYTNYFSTNPVARQILTRDSSFTFEAGVWVGSLSGATTGTNNAGVMNVGDVVQQFMTAPPNVNAQNPIGNAQQVLVVNN